MIIIKSASEIERMYRAGQLVKKTLELIKSEIKPGITTLDLDRIAEDFIRKNGAIPAFKGYQGFPNSICVAINDVVVHGIPSQECHLKEGDIIGIDIGVILEGFYGDAAVTVPVGQVTAEAAKLIETTEQALFKGIEQAVAGNYLTDISHAIQTYTEERGYSVVRNFVGHGIGRSMHEDPQVPNFGKPKRGPILKAGMTLAIEPMVNIGSYEVRIMPDNWTVKTRDGSLSAHFEHTVAITDGEPYLLTK
jgi:methionyl aminopeptidase